MSELIPWWNLLPQPPDQNKLLLAQQNMLKLQEMQRQQQSQNALRQMFADPRMVDPNSGQFRPAAIPQIGQQDPALAMDVQSSMAKSATTGLQNQLLAGKVREDERKRVMEAFLPARDDYYRVLQETGSPEQAQKAAQTGYDKTMQEVLPTVTPETRRSLQANPNFDINRMNRNLMADPQFRQSVKEEQEFTTQTDYGRTPPVQYRLYKNGRMTDITGAGAYTPTGVAETKGAEAQLYEGKDAQGKPVTVRMGPMGGFVDAQTNQPMQNVSGLRKIGTKGEESPEEIGRPTGPPELHGEEYLNALPGNRAAMIRGYAEGRVAFPGSFALRSPYWQKMVADITQYDPTFDAVNYNARAATRKDFTSGKSAQNITSFNTAIGHLGTLQKAGESLNNSWSPAYNTAANFLITQKGDPRVTDFNVAAQAVASELTRAFRGTGGSLTEVEEWKKNLNAAGSPEQIRAAIRKGVELLASRINAVGEQYRRGMGTTADVTELLTPAARKTLASLPGGEELIQEVPPVGGTRGTGAVPGQGAAAPAQSAPPPAGALPQEAVSKLQEGQETTFSNGQVWTLKGGNAVRVR